MLHKVWERVMQSHSGGYCSDHVHLWYHWHSQRQGRFLTPMNDWDCVNVKVQRSTNCSLQETTLRIFRCRFRIFNKTMEIWSNRDTFFWEVNVFHISPRCHADTRQPHRHYCGGRWRLWWHGRCRGPSGRHRHSRECRDHGTACNVDAYSFLNRVKWWDEM